VLARVATGSSSLLAPLDDVVHGRDSKDLIVWSDHNRAAFTSAKTALSANRSITLPRRQDKRWVVADGSVKQRGLGVTLYITRDDKSSLQASSMQSCAQIRLIGYHVRLKRCPSRLP
jgi:hypothetical protein